MISLKFNEQACKTCPTSDCLVKCQYMDFDRESAKEEMLKIFGGEDSPVLHNCVTCYGCEEYCKGVITPFILSLKEGRKRAYSQHHGQLPGSGLISESR